MANFTTIYFHTLHVWKDTLFFKFFPHENIFIFTQIELRFGEPVNCSGHGRLDNKINTAKYKVNEVIRFICGYLKKTPHRYFLSQSDFSSFFLN